MNKVSLALILSSLATVGFSAESSAQGFKVDPGLQQVKPYKARRQIDIIDTSPIVKDHRRPEEAPTKYVIQVPDLPAAKQKTVIIKVPGGANGQNGMVFTDGSTPPPAGFESNMHALKRPSGLPATKMGGVPVQTTKKRIRGRMSPHGKPPRGLLIKPKGQEKVLKYDKSSDNGSISAQESSTVKTKLRGERIKKFKRGTLLNSK